MITKNVRLYLGDGFHVRIPVSQFDTMWRFVFDIFYKSQAWEIPDGAEVVLNGRKPDGNVFAFSGTVTGNKATVDCDVQMTAVAGPVVCELSILSDGKVVGTANFILDVEAAPKSPEDVSSESTLPAYGEILDRIAEMGGGGGSVNVDDELSSTSENPVQNKVIKEALDTKYVKPSGGIPKTDLASDVQTSLGKADTALQSAPVTSVNTKTGAVTLTASDVGALPSDTPIPAEVTEQTVARWGFTKNTGTYTKPHGGIPASDLASAVQTSLDKVSTIPNSRNDYVSPAFPPVVYLLVGDEFPVYGRNLLRPAYSIALGSYTNATEIRAHDDYTVIKTLSAATKTVPYYVFDEHMNRVESGSFSLVASNTAPINATMLAIGDSFLTQNALIQRIWARYSGANRTLTTLGTKGTSQVRYEGYAGKKWTDFWNGFSGSPFGENGFDFAAYMTAHGYSAPDYVYLQLGTNDASPKAASDYDTSDVVAAAQGIVNNILAYNSNIKILIGMAVMPTLLADKFADKYNGIGWNWILRWNMQKQNAAILDEFKSNGNVRVVPCNLNLDSASDIADNVHPNASGYQKIADIVYSTMVGW